MTKQMQQYVRAKDIDNRSTFGQRVLWRIEALAWDVIYILPMKLLGPERASKSLGWLLRKLGPLLSQHKTVLRNLRLAFPEWSEAERETVALQSWGNIGRTAGELPHVPRIMKEADKRVSLINPEVLTQIANSGKGAVFVSGHLANWEVMAGSICNSSVDVVMTYRSLNNPHIDKKLNKLRHDYGTDITMPKGMGTRELMRALARHQSVALMNDQKFNEGQPVTFFGHEAMTAPGPSRLAVKYNVPIVMVSTRRTAPAKFEITFNEPVQPPQSGDTAADVRTLVEQITAFMEKEVRANPTQWFWQHRRWPKQAWVEAGVMDAPAESPS